MAERDTYEEYMEGIKNKDSKWSKISKQVKPFHVIGFLVLFFFGANLSASGKIQSNYFFGAVISFIILAIFLMFRDTNEQKLIPEHIIKQIVYNALDKKRQKGIEIPFDAKIKVTLVGENIYEQDFVSGTSGTIRRDVGFEIIRKGYKKVGVAGVHPYNGTILGFRFESLGYSGKETKDRTIIPVSELKK